MKKTPHYYAVVLAHERIRYGELMEKQPDVLKAMKTAIFRAAKELFEEAERDGIELDAPPPDTGDSAGD